MYSLLILIPLVVIILMNLFMKKAQRSVAWVGVVIALWQVCFILFCRNNPACCCAGTADTPLKYFNLNFTADTFSSMMLLCIAIVACAAFMIGKSTIKGDEKLFDFTNLVLLSLIGMNGIVMVNDIFSMYVFLEVTAVASFILIALNKDLGGLEGSFKYLVLSAIATILMLTSIALFFTATGTTDLSVLRYSIGPAHFNVIVILAICIFTGAFFIKGGLFPFHGWLPDAYSSAPTSVSVLLAGIVTKTTGVYVLMRMFSWSFGLIGAEPMKILQGIIMLVGAMSIVFGAFAAITQKDFKRMLAYSSISQVGYIILALGINTPLGFAGAIFHIFNHAIFKSQLFANAAAIEKQTGTTDMDKLGGLTAKMPVTGFTSVIACLSTAGIPPFAGFWSKLVIIIALWQSGHIAYTFVAVLASLVTLGYFLSLQRRVFFGKLAEGFENLKEADFGIIFPAIVLAVITVMVGVLFPLVVNSIILPVVRIL